MFAGRDIASGDEIRYDYGGGDMPWRKVNYLMTVLFIYGLKFVLLLNVMLENFPAHSHNI